ncbi:37760_t:CDS:1, partial [Gigaspora margarita]
VGLIIKMPSGALCLQINAFPVADDDNSPIYSSQFLVDNVDDNGYFHVKNYLVYQGLMYYFFAANNETGISDPCAVGFDHSRDYLSADITNDPW